MGFCFYSALLGLNGSRVIHLYNNEYTYKIKFNHLIALLKLNLMLEANVKYFLK